MSKTMTSKEELEIALRMQKRMLAETRQKLKDIQETLEDNKEQIKVQEKEICWLKQNTARLERDGIIVVTQKDQTIEILKRRIANVNAKNKNGEIESLY